MLHRVQLPCAAMALTLLLVIPAQYGRAGASPAPINPAAPTVAAAVRMAAAASKAKPTTKPRPATPSPNQSSDTPRAGEIQLIGDVLEADNRTSTLVLLADRFTLPSARSGAINPPKQKLVTVTKSTRIVSADTGKVMEFGTISPAGARTVARVLVVGKDEGSGKPLVAREVVVIQAAAAPAGNAQ